MEEGYSMSTLEVVVGGQFGSEAKGHITQRLTEHAIAGGKSPMVVRVAGPNAGHTGYDKDERKWALRQMPVASVVDGPVMLGIAAGSEVDPVVLLDEFDALSDAGLLDGKMMWVSEEATLINDQDAKNEQGDADLVNKIGSTGKGIGSARSRRIMRSALRVADSRFLREELDKRGVVIAPAAFWPEGEFYAHTIIEGTQGYGLGLHAGFYPKCTSSDCRAIDFMAMAGVHPWLFDETKVHVVARIFPIRVAGESGPMPSGETTWEALGLPEEHTTVTKKVRRVAQPDWPLVAEAVRANGGAPVVRVALTMLDQIFPEIKDKHLWEEEVDSAVMNKIRDYIKGVQVEVGAPIEWVATGPNTATNIRMLEL
jgi:adenylosuccinate synthase